MDKRDETLIEGWKNRLNNAVEGENINTEALQWISLRLYLDDAGYDLFWNKGSEVVHIKHKDRDHPRQFISLDKAISMHNGTSCGFMSRTSWEWDALRNRVLDTVYLQRVKGSVKCNEYQVKFNTWRDDD